MHCSGLVLSLIYDCAAIKNLDCCANNKYYLLTWCVPCRMMCVCVLAKVTAPDVYAILPPQTNDRQPENVSRWLLDGLLTYMVSEVISILHYIIVIIITIMKVQTCTCCGPGIPGCPLCTSLYRCRLFLQSAITVSKACSSTACHEECSTNRLPALHRITRYTDCGYAAQGLSSVQKMYCD